MAISRRTFLVSAAGAGVGFGLGAISHQFPLASPHFGPDWAPGKETFAPSTCLLCPAHCGIRARLVDGRATRLDGNPLHPVSQGGLCAKGCAGLQLLYHPGRLTGPVERVGPPGSDTFRPISWDAALTRVVSALRSAGQGGASAPIEWMVGDVSGVMAELIAGFSRVTGASRLSVDDYRDGSAEILRMCQGIASPPAFDLGSADVVLSFGAGLSEAWWALPLAARARDAASGRAPWWIQIDARLSRSATSADEWVAVRPESYGALAMGLTYILVKEGLYDQDDLSSGLAGWEDWTDAAGMLHAGYRTLVLRHGRPDDVSARTGVPVNRLTAVAKTFGQARRGVAVWDQTVSWRSGGMADALAVHALNAVTSRIGRPGGLLLQTPMPALPGPLQGVPAGAPDLARAALTSANWPAAGDQAAPSAVLFVYQANPLASLPDSTATRDALARVSLVVSFSPFFDETARSANLILPDHTYLERWQDAPAPAAVAFPVWGVVQPIVKPMHNTRATGDVLLDLATRLGGEAKAWARWPSVEELVKQRGRSLAAATRGSTFVDLFRQGELREVQDRGWWLSHGQSPDEYWQTMLETGGWFDPVFDYNDGAGRSQHAGRRIWVYPADARERLQKSGGALAEGFLPAVAAPTGPPPSDFPLQLIPFRVMTLASGGTALMPWLLERLDVLHDQAWETWIEINPATAAAHAVESGARVRVESAAGAFEAAVRVFAGAQPGVVHVPYGLHTRVEGWGVPRGANPLAAVGRRVDPVSGLPDWHSTRVRLVRV